MDNVQKAIDLSDHLGEKVECIKFESIRSNENGAFLWQVECESGEDRFVIEGETGTLVGRWESEEEALEAWGE